MLDTYEILFLTVRVLIAAELLNYEDYSIPLTNVVKR
jgi:hypothetical protein